MLDTSAIFVLRIAGKRPANRKGDSVVSIFKDTGTLAAVLYLFRITVLTSESKSMTNGR